MSLRVSEEEDYKSSGLSLVDTVSILDQVDYFFVAAICELADDVVSQSLTGGRIEVKANVVGNNTAACLLYTSPSPRDGLLSRMPSSA